MKREPRPTAATTPDGVPVVEGPVVIYGEWCRECGLVASFDRESRHTCPYAMRPRLIPMYAHPAHGVMR